MATVQLPKMIGATVKRKEDSRLITGEGKFTDDVHLRHMAFMGVVRSPRAHARILSVDVSAALRHPGVLGAFTGREVRDLCSAPFPLMAVKEDMKVKTRWPMAVEFANHVGEPVAAVVAASRTAARDALDLVEVEYEILPAVVDLESAASPESPRVHLDLKDNLCVAYTGRAGDPDAAFATADGVISARFEEPRVMANPMEPRVVVASYERGSALLTVWNTTQGPHKDRGDIAEVLGLPENKVRVIAIDVGGGFGCKNPLYPEPCIAALFSMRLGRPIKWTEERQEHFICTDHGRGQVQHVEAAYRNDGTLLGTRVSYYTDLGAYCHGSSHSVAGVNTPAIAPGMYTLRNLDWTTYGVYTNKVCYGPYRGYGKAEPTYMIERVLDMIARNLGMDPADVRRKNFIPKDAFPYMTATGMEYDSGDYHRALDLALDVASYPKLKEEQRKLRDSGELMGIGIATNVEISSFGPSSAKMASTAGYCAGTVRVDTGGKVTVLTGASPHGQGIETTYAQIVADELQVPFEDVEVCWGDTSVAPPGGSGTAATRSLVVGGTAVIVASQQVMEKARSIAASLLGVATEHIMLEDGRFVAEDIPDKSLTWADVGNEAYQAGSLPPDMERGLEATSYWEPPNYTFPFAAHLAVVRIDRDTGEVTLSQYICVDDSGTIINPMVVDGQVHGALAQGIGTALFEEARWDESGQLITGSFLDYAMPLAEEFPMFTLDRTETPSPNNPMGAKGAGETGMLAAAPAIVNAMVDALAHLGVTNIDLPVTSEKVWRVLKEVDGSL